MCVALTVNIDAICLHRQLAFLQNVTNHSRRFIRQRASFQINELLHLYWILTNTQHPRGLRVYTHRAIRQLDNINVCIILESILEASLAQVFNARNGNILIRHIICQAIRCLLGVLGASLREETGCTLQRRITNRSSRDVELASVKLKLLKIQRVNMREVSQVTMQLLRSLRAIQAHSTTCFHAFLHEAEISLTDTLITKRQIIELHSQLVLSQLLGIHADALECFLSLQATFQLLHFTVKLVLEWSLCKLTWHVQQALSHNQTVCATTQAKTLSICNNIILTCRKLNLRLRRLENTFGHD